MRRSSKVTFSILMLILFSSVMSFAQNSTIPTPESVLGFKPGTDYKLANWDQLVEYFTLLSSASDRVIMKDIGKTEMDNPMMRVLISSPENLKNIDKIKEIQYKLADPRLTNDSELESLVENGKTVVLFTCSLHGTEVGASQMTPIMAYQLATGSSKNIMDILENVVIVLMPSANPDGVQMIANHYNAQNPGPGVEIKSLPRLYSKYTGHDNNRDWYMMTQRETQLIAKEMYKEWLPEIVFDMHQMGNGGARFFLPPFADPLNPEIDPMVVRQLQLIGGYFSTDLIAGGYPWVQNMRSFSMWWHGGMRTAPYFHNMVGILSEAASANLATPVPATNADYPIPTINYPVVWKHDREWRIGDIVEQDRIAAFALLKAAARNKDLFLTSFYNMNKQSIEDGKNGPVYAYVMPSDQHDPAAFHQFIDLMTQQKTEFYIAEEDFTADGNGYKKGSVIAYLSQPSRAHVESIFGVQVYPEDAGQPYDITGWTLPGQMGVQYDRVTGKFDARTKKLGMPGAEHKRTFPEKSKLYLLSPNASDHFAAVNREQKAGRKVKMLTSEVTIDGNTYPAGTKVLEGKTDLAKTFKGITAKLTGVSKVDNKAMAELKKPRIAMLDDPSNMPAGWLKWILEKYEFDYDLLSREELLTTGIDKKYTIMIAPVSLVNVPRRRGPAPEATIPDEIKTALDKFVSNGGSVISWGSNADMIAKAMGLQVSKLNVSRDKFSVPGSILEASITTGDPLTYGMLKKALVFFGRGATAWESTEGEVVGNYPRYAPLVSGYGLGSEMLKNKPNIVRFTKGKGTVTLIGFDPVFRAQPVNTFKLLFNAIVQSATK